MSCGTQKWPRIRVSSQTRLLANDMNEKVKPGTVHRSPDIYLTAEENPEKSQLKDRLMKTVRPLIIP